MALVLRLLNRSRSSPAQLAIFRRSIAMSSVRLQTEEAVEQLKEKNPFYEKYASKLAALQQAAPEEFLEKVNKVVKPAPAPKVVETPR